MEKDREMIQKGMTKITKGTEQCLEKIYWKVISSERKRLWDNKVKIYKIIKKANKLKA